MTPDEVAPAANDTVYGLAAGIWTNYLTKGTPSDPAAAGRHRVAQRWRGPALTAVEA